MRHVLITAGTKGLGRKITDYFLDNGYSVTVIRSDKEKAEQLLEERKEDSSEFISNS